MIVYDLRCSAGHVFEAWFGGADDYADQQARGLLACPLCGEGALERLPSAVAIGGKAARPADEGRRRESGSPGPGEPARVAASTPESESGRGSKHGRGGGGGNEAEQGSPSAAPSGSAPPHASPPVSEPSSVEKVASRHGPVDAEKVKTALAALAKAQAEAVAKSDYVGDRFAEEARAMHYGEQEARPIYGETKRAEAEALREEGVPAMPLLFPVRQRSDA